MPRTTQSIQAELNSLTKQLEEQRGQIAQILLHVETRSTVDFEIEASIKTLGYLKSQTDLMAKAAQKEIVTVFLPQNLPLYSLMLYAIAPAIAFPRIIARPPVEMQKTYQALQDMLKGSERISLVHMERQKFIEAYNKGAAITVFTGKYENAIKVYKTNPASLFIYNGAGINPIIVFEDAPLDWTISKTMEARTFNSGQDCCAPDIIFVQEGVLEKFLEKLIDRLKQLKLGEAGDPSVDIHPLVSSSSIKNIEAYKNKHEDKLVYSSYWNPEKKMMGPMVFKWKSWQEASFFEFFGPVFNIVAFKDERELQGFFGQPKHHDYSMYCSVFSRSKRPAVAEDSIVLNNQTILELEDPGVAFGGYGKKSSFVIKDCVITPRPILIPQVMAEYFEQLRTPF